MKVSKKDLFSCLPPEWPEDLLPQIQAQLIARGTKVVVLDDDPTGTQTVYNVPVFTDWSLQTLADMLAEPGHIAYILTNSRSMPLDQAQAINLEIGTNLRLAGCRTGRPFVVISRSDSTLRGHYPGEVTALAEGLGQTSAAILIIPFFLEGGRFTINNVHYVAEGDFLIPAAETEYARDAVFGYHHSNLRDWVVEKHGGKIRPESVACVSLEDLRCGGPEKAASILHGLEDGQVCIVNAAAYRDLEVLVAGLLTAEAHGRPFLYRTAASFVRVRGGLPPLQGPPRLPEHPANCGGLIVAGSYIQKSTVQIQAALSLPNMVGLEADVSRLLNPAARRGEIQRLAATADEALQEGKDVVIYTSRHLVVGPDRETSLRIGQEISTALVAVVRSLVTRPAWLIAKGGITSSDIATQALQVRRAQVIGQIIPGIPIWHLGQESRWPGLIYVVFPGNVGDADALARMVRFLRGGNEG